MYIMYICLCFQMQGALFCLVRVLADYLVPEAQLIPKHHFFKPIIMSGKNMLPYPAQKLNEVKMIKILAHHAANYRVSQKSADF